MFESLKSFRVSFVYGPPGDVGRKDFWRRLNNIAKGIHNEPWLCVGDFNELISNDEACGGALRDVRRMKLFREFIFYAKLIDIGHKGPSFTW